MDVVLSYAKWRRTDQSVVQSCAFKAQLINIRLQGILTSLGEARMSDKNFRITFTRGTNSSVITTSVRASSASQAKEKIKERERGQAKIISAVET